MTGIAAGVDACIAMIDQNPKATKAQLQVISKVVRQGIKDVRNSLNKLRPGALEEHSLKEAIERMIGEFSSVSDLTIALEYELENIDLEKQKKKFYLELYRNLLRMLCVMDMRQKFIFIFIRKIISYISKYKIMELVVIMSIMDLA